MAIKKNAATFFSRSPQREVDAARGLGPAFDITRAGDHDGYRFWIAKADEQTSRRFGLARELLVLFCPHLSTDARAVRAFREVEKDFAGRIDPVIGIIVFSGDNIEEFRGEAHRAGLEANRVLIPLHVDEIMVQRDDQREWLTNLIAKRVGDLNLFSTSSPVPTDDLFFGRDDLVHRITSGISESGTSFGLFGLRKSGKTSILYAVRRRLPRSCKPILIDCQSPGTHQRRWWSLLHLIASRYAEEHGDGILRDMIVRPYTPDDAADRFRALVKSAVLKANTSRIVLLLDEIEFVVPAENRGTHWNTDFVPFWQTLRAIRQELGDPIAVVCAGVNGRFTQQPFVDGSPNPILEMLQSEYVAGLSEQSLAEMTTTIGGYMGISFDADVAQFLRRTYGGHPYLCRIACSVVSKKAIQAAHLRKGVRADHFQVDEVALEIRERSNAPLRDVLLSLALWHPDEYDILMILATGDDDGFVRDWRVSDPAGAQRIGGYGIADLESGEFYIRDLATFLVANGEQYRSDVAALARTDVDPDLIPEMVDIPKLQDLAGRRAELENGLRRLIVQTFAVIERNDRARIADRVSRKLTPRERQITVRDSFIGRSVADVLDSLYLQELSRIISTDWEHFSYVFEDSRPRFDANMETLFTSRRQEAHSKRFTEDEYNAWRASYEWAVGCLRRAAAALS